jgi:alpha-NAC-related protein
MFKKKTQEERVQDMMKKFNINIERIEAKEVIINTDSKKIIISSPEVMKTKIMGRDVYQITGQMNEAPSLNEEDISLVMKKTGKDRETVVKKLEELNNDLVRAIIELKEKKKEQKKVKR